MKRPLLLFSWNKTGRRDGGIVRRGLMKSNYGFSRRDVEVLARIAFALVFILEK